MSDPLTLCSVFFEGLRFRRPGRIRWKRGGEWTSCTTAEFADRVARCAGALLAAGVAPGDRVAIFSYNRVEWAVVDYAALIVGAVVVPLYSTLPADQAVFILKDSGSKLAFVEDAERAARLSGCDARRVAFGEAAGVEGFEAFLSAAGPLSEDALRERASRVQPADLATLIYTSGTTGRPKGVMLTHENIASNVHGSCIALAIGPDDVVLSFLPLSHSFERTVDYAAFRGGADIAYAESIDAVAKNLVEVRPTIMAAVPRFYEKVRAKVMERVQGLSPFQRRMFDRAFRTATEAGDYVRRGARPPLGLRWRLFWARRFVLARLQKATGGRIRFFVSGGAALPREVAEFFYGLGLPILEGYGLTETSPVIAVNRLGAAKLGTVGQPIPNCTVKIADDGEVLVRGPNVMTGYYGQAEETAQVIVDGWFHTGDIGEIDADGYLRITDRKKDLLKTSGGKYVAPQPIENRIKLSPYVKNVVVIGDQRKFAAALVVPDADACRRDSVEPRAAIQKVVDEVNAGLGSWEQVKKFALLEKDFTIESGELTPTLKVKRRVVAERYREIIEGLYAGG